MIQKHGSLLTDNGPNDERVEDYARYLKVLGALRNNVDQDNI